MAELPFVAATKLGGASSHQVSRRGGMHCGWLKDSERSAMPC